VNDTIIATDFPLTDEQRTKLRHLLNALIPASQDGHMTSAGELDLIAYLKANAVDFLPVLLTILDDLDEEFLADTPEQHHQGALALSHDNPALFQELIYQVYALYYQNPVVLEGIGAAAGPPFPRGNTVESGDLSLLDPVLAIGKRYRPVS
jgi:hypothetical protein